MFKILIGAAVTALAVIGGVVALQFAKRIDVADEDIEKIIDDES